MSAEYAYYALSEAIDHLNSAAEILRDCNRSEADTAEELARDLEIDRDDLGARLDESDAADRAWEERQYRASV